MQVKILLPEVRSPHARRVAPECLHFICERTLTDRVKGPCRSGDKRYCCRQSAGVLINSRVATTTALPTRLHERRYCGDGGGHVPRSGHAAACNASAVSTARHCARARCAARGRGPPHPRGRVAESGHDAAAAAAARAARGAAVQPGAGSSAASGKTAPALPAHTPETRSRRGSTPSPKSRGRRVAC